jgi:hypothetical protein
MHISRVILAATALRSVDAVSIGFTTFKVITEGTDNSLTVSYQELPNKSDTINLMVDILEGKDHAQIVDDFKTLAKNYGSHGVKLIPRIRYGSVNGTEAATEPSNQTLLLQDVSLWASAISSISDIIQIPVIQAGFLGPWGEWHVSVQQP